MCQLCVLNSIARGERWPKPLEPHISDLNLLVSTAHTELLTYQSCSTSSSITKENKPTTISKITITTTTTPKEAARQKLLTTLRGIQTLLELLAEERESWWEGKAKERKFWRETYQGGKITRINVVNNKTGEMIDGLKARLGTFCRWSLGFEDGVEGLNEDRVAKVEGDVKMEG
ncbi:hypothetical protein D6D15_00875 [Aureobasidium pullulans]|uniref:Uncharacterized protein n=1 Tax=Aureobasidium pullulans TaxID=5580 RepID=A0A4S9BTC8_AURPU|nr:hypothetical protein D6D15_00875 [Aureobasidium pullulans]